MITLIFNIDNYINIHIVNDYINIHIVNDYINIHIVNDYINIHIVDNYIKSYHQYSHQFSSLIITPILTSSTKINSLFIRFYV